MKKINALLGLLLTGLALSACDKKGDNVNGDNKDANNTAENGGSYGDNGGNSGNADGYKYDANKAAWSDAEKNIFVTFLHNADVPYKNIDQETELVFDEDYSRAIKTAPVCSDTILAQYGALFDNTWSNYSYFNDEDDGQFYYAFEKGFETAEGTRYVNVTIYGGEYDEDYGDYAPTADGSGTFVIEIYDPYYYAFPADLVAQMIEYFELESTIPAIEADYFEFEDTYLMFGMCYLGIYAYGDASLLTIYTKALTDAGFEKFDTNDGYDCYKTAAEDIEIDIKYFADYSVLAIEIFEVQKTLEGDSLTAEAFGLDGDSSYKEFTAKGASGAEYKGKISNASQDIQLRVKGNDTGIVVTKSAGTVAAIAVNFTSTTARSVMVYGSNSPFAITDMFDEDNDAVEYVVTLSNSSADYVEYEFTKEYAYIGIRSASSAVNLDEIIIAWDDGTEEPDEQEGNDGNDVAEDPEANAD